jgi:hypothetical protein
MHLHRTTVPLPLLFTVIAGVAAQAVTRYVNVNSATPVSPYTSWGTAAIHIQDAVDVANADDLVLVTNGTYSSGGRAAAGQSLQNRVSADKPISIHSVNGAAATVIAGAGPLGDSAVRCVYLTNRATLLGFTLRAGHTLTAATASADYHGGGAVVRGGSAVRDSVMEGCGAYGEGGGAYADGGSLISNCTMRGNSGRWAGGGAYARRSTVMDCWVNCNTSYYTTFYIVTLHWGEGGGIGAEGGTVSLCRVERNYSTRGGGASITDGVISRCRVSENCGMLLGGVILHHGKAEDCLVASNTAASSIGYGTGGIWAGSTSTVAECTVSGNAASNNCGGLWLQDYSSAYNSIMQGNKGAAGIENRAYSNGGVFTYCCLSPVVTGSADGGGNLMDDPVFYDCACGGYRLATSSPCRDRGANAHVISTKDLDGRQRIINATVDLGCHEFVAPHAGSPLHYASKAGSDTWPYSSSGTATPRIQDAIDAALAGEEVRIDSGTYDQGGRAVRGMGTRMAVDKPLTVRGTGLLPRFVRGATDPNTGGRGPAAMRCAYVTNGAEVIGLYFSGGHTKTSGDASNERSGGGVLLDHGGMVSNCAIMGNSAQTWGGGAYCYYGGTVMRCTVYDNAAGAMGGGVRCYGGGSVIDSVVSGNTAPRGGGVQVQIRGVVRDCQITRNEAAALGGGAYATDGATYESCTIASNRAVQAGGGVYYGSAVTSHNCIVYHNSAPVCPNYTNEGTEICYRYCATWPALSGALNGPGNRTNDPWFRNAAAGDYQLAEGSPCINAGTNLPWMAAATDLAGNPRIYDGRVDMGCYEFVPESGTLLASLILAIGTLRCMRPSRSHGPTAQYQ